MDSTTFSPSTILWLAFCVGAAFGAIAGRTHFCTMGAVSDIVNMGEWSRMRMWLMAIAVAIIGVAVLQGVGLIDPQKTIYRGAQFNWLAYVVGGLSFGFGMVLASGCGGKTLVRIGGGNLKSLVVFAFLGLSADMTMRGLFSSFRVGVLEKVNFSLEGGQGLPALLATYLPPFWAELLPVMFIGGGLMAFCLVRKDFWTFDNLLGGLGIGLAVLAGWLVSGYFGYLPEDPNTLEEAFLTTNSGRMESLTFVAPQAYALELLLFWSDTSRKLSFGIATALGVVVGAWVYALASRNFRWEGFRGVEDTANHIVGAVFMGFGGVTAMGCTVGQGITGISTLALGSFLVFAAILVGAWLGLKYQIWRLMREG